LSGHRLAWCIAGVVDEGVGDDDCISLWPMCWWSRPKIMAKNHHTASSCHWRSSGVLSCFIFYCYVPLYNCSLYQCWLLHGALYYRWLVGCNLRHHPSSNIASPILKNFCMLHTWILIVVLCRVDIGWHDDCFCCWRWCLVSVIIVDIVDACCCRTKEPSRY
jgi:hypothetical protein